MDEGRTAVSQERRLAFLGNKSGSKGLACEKNRPPCVGAKNKKKHVTFMKPSDNKVKLVVPPSPAEKGKYWFQETETQVVKPVIFTISSMDKVSIEVDTALMITAVVAQTAEKKQPSPKRRREEEQTKEGRPQQQATTSLLVCRNMGGVYDSLDERLQMAMGNKAQVVAQRRKELWFTTATVADVGTAVRTHVILPPGTYIIKCAGPHDLIVFAQAEDIALKLQ
jgi:hypothetical protein